MKMSEDFCDLLMALAKAKVEYLLIGGYAVSLLCKPRYTKDIDIWVRSNPRNFQRLSLALEAYDRRVLLQLHDGVAASVISMPDLLSAKRAAGRPQDLVDAEVIEALLRT